jgi:hypothetical protein
VRALRNGGWELDSVWDGEESTPVTNETEVVKLITDLDQAHLYVKKGDETGWVFFVLGNEPYEVINDNTVNLSDAIDPMTDAWWETV